MPRTLRSRLVASHLLVIGLAFLLTVLVAAIPVRRAQVESEERRLSSVAQVIAMQSDWVTRGDVGPVGRGTLEAFLLRQSRVHGARVLLADASGTVVLDPAGAGRLEGARMESLAREIALARADARQLDREIARVVPLAVARPAGRIDGRLAAVATTTGSNDRSNAALYPVALSPRRQLPVLDTLVRPLVLAGLVAAGAAIGTSLWLARSVTRPLSQLTRAAGTITAGSLDARVPESPDADDETGQLVRAFNAMLDRLAVTYRAQRALLANIAHELRSPLTSVQGYAQALRDGVVSDERARAEALAVIHDESERMSELVQQILQLSRLESGQLPLRPAPVALDALLERVLRSFEQRARAAGVTLDTHALPRLRLEADAELLLQAVGNLVANAIRHTPSGGTVRVSATRVTPAGGMPVARVTVTDTGEGIAPADLPHIFERFYRGSESDATDASPGAAPGQARRFGLGLAITREIVSRHGGTIAVASEPGRGTTFTIDLPVAAPAATEPGAPT